MFTCGICRKEIKDEFMREDEEGKFCLRCGFEEGLLDGVNVKTAKELIQDVWGIDREDENAISVEIFDGSLDYISVNTYKAVKNNFKTTKRTAVMQDYLDNYGNNFSQENVEKLADEFGYDVEWINTYNGESVLDHTLQFAVLYKGDDWIYAEDQIVVMSYHYSSDVRTNYSPYILLQPYLDFPDFMWGLNRLYAYDGEGNNWESYDAGYSWEYHGINKKSLTTTEFYDKLEVRDKEVYWNGNKLNFSSRLIE